MAEGPLPRRANPRFSFFADAEVTLRDGTGVRGATCRIELAGCYIDTLDPFPFVRNYVSASAMACAHANCTAKCYTCILAAASEFSAGRAV